MMYTFSNTAKRATFLCMAIGIIAVVLGFMNSTAPHPSDEEVRAEIHEIARSLNMPSEVSLEEIEEHNFSVEKEASVSSHYDMPHFLGVYSPVFAKFAEKHHAHFAKNEMLEANSIDRVADIAVHFFHSKAQRPWSAIMYSNFFFLAIALGGLFFYAIQYASQSGWSALILRIPQAMQSYLFIGGLVMLAIILTGAAHLHHLYHWMDPELIDIDSEHYDYLIAGKAGYLNVPFFIVRAIIYLAAWILIGRSFVKFSLKEDEEGGTKWYTKSFKRSAIFLVVFAVSSSMMAWDWIMSIDPHWFSTLFGWFIFAGLWVSCITVIMFITVYLKKQGHLKEVNENHYHDYGRMMLSFSNLWTYLWFAQFMLIWYANIPEEVTYYWIRFEEYQTLFIGTVVLNWGVPILFLMSRDSKRSAGKLMFAGTLMLIGHALNAYILVMPGSVGAHYALGFTEIGTFIGFAGLFVFITMKSLEKRPLVQKNHPMLEESIHHVIH